MQTIRLHLLFLLTFSSLIFAQEQIGVAAAVNRNTTDLTLEQERKLVEAGYQIIQNHTIETDEIGKAQMLLLDGTAFSVGPNSSVVLDRFIYNPETAEGSLEVTARGLFRIVGGKVTKNQPALIRTDSATVGIRGGIGIVQTNGSQVNATFLYGEEMTVTPNCVDLDTFGDQCSSDFITTITEPGFSVTVESADSEPSEPEPITEESIEAVQDELEANEEEPAEEGSSSDETSSEESANDSSSAASPNEDSSDDSSVDESSSDDSVASDSSGEESNNEVTQETETETEVADADDGGSTEVEVDEELLDSSGVSDVSSDVAPDELGTADAFEVETEVDLVDVDESSAEEVAEEVAQTTQETTAEVVPIAEVEAAQNTQETPAEVAPIFEVETVELVESLDENINEITLASFAVVNPGEQNFTVTIEGESSQAFAYNSESNSLEIIEALDHESQEAVELIVTFTSDNGDVQEFPLTFNVVDVDEPAAIATTLSNASFAENIAVGTTIGRVNVTDPEDSAVTYSLSGNGSDNFSIDNSGNISLASALNYETASSYELTVVVDDGTNASTEVITVNVTDINESPTLTAALALNSVQENTATGTTIATSSVTDPEAGTITYSLSGTGSENFSVSSDGTVTLANALDYETTTVYEIILTASDGVNSVSDTLTINVGDINEAPTLTTTLAAANFAENVATGTTIATSSVSDPESSTITYSLSGTGSNNFSVDTKGNVTLANSLDYETTTSYTITLTASDGTNSVLETITINVIDVTEINALAVTLASSGVALAESSNSGVTVATSSINNPGGESITYALSGTGSDKFSVDSSGNVTTNGSLDYETAKSYALTLTATAGDTSVTDNFTVNVANEVELESALLRYSAAYHSPLRNGFSATATRGPSGSTLPAYYLEQVGHTDSSSIRNYDGSSYAEENAGVYTNIGGGNIVNVYYTFPIINRGGANRPFVFYGNNDVYQSASISNVWGGGTNVTIDTSGIISAGHTHGNTFWFMTTNNAEDSFQINNQNSYSSITDYTVSWDDNNVLLNDSGNSIRNDSIGIGGSEIDFAPGEHAVFQIDLPAPFTFYDQSITSLWVNSNGFASSTGPVTGDNDYVYSANDGQKGYALDTLYDDRTWDDGNKPSNVNLHGTALNYSMFPWWRAQTTGYASKGYYVDRVAQNGQFIIGWYMFYEHTTPGVKTTSGAYLGAYDMSYEIVLNYLDQSIQFRYDGFPNSTYNTSGTGVYNNLAIGLTGDLSTSGCTWAGSSNSSRSCAGAYEAVVFRDLNSTLGSTDNESYGSFGSSVGGFTFTPSAGTNATSSFGTYNLFADQVTLAGIILPDNWLENYLSNSKRVFAFMVSPIEYFSPAGTTNDYFYPNFIPNNLWSYGDVGVDYCNEVGFLSSEQCASDIPWGNATARYLWITKMWSATDIYTSRFYETTVGSSAWNNIPEGQSLWWQVVNSNGVGVGLWAQISFKDSYDGAQASTTRDDQESLLNVVISNVDYRKNDTTRYSAGDTGFGMDGYHYWSYQGATNVDNDGLGINYGTSTVECATSNETGCFWAWNDTADSSIQSAMITSSDPYKSGDMTLSVNYNSNTDTFSTGTFNMAIKRNSIILHGGQSNVSVGLSGNEECSPWGNCEYMSYRDDSVFRATRFYESTASTYNGFFSGILEFDVSGSGNSQLASMRSSNTLASFSFDTTNDDLQVVAPMTISAAPANNYTSNWTTVDTGSMTLKFGDATNDEAKSAYLSSEVFGAEIQDDGAQIDGSSGGSNNLAGVMVSYNTLDKGDSDLFHDNGNDSMPNTAYSTWGFWAMSSLDISPNAGTQNASVHLGTWVGGETLAQNEIPTSGSASMSGAAVMNVAYRYNQTGTNYDVHKYTTTADVSATFNWGTNGYSGSLNFSDFDNNNPIVANAGFTAFNVAIAGTDHTYAGNSTDTLTNGWLGGASVAGALYGGTTPDESGGRINVNLYKSGDIGTAGANDFYMAEGIYLLD